MENAKGITNFTTKSLHNLHQNKIKLTSKKLKWAYFMNLPIHYSDDSNFSKASSDMLDL